MRGRGGGPRSWLRAARRLSAAALAGGLAGGLPLAVHGAGPADAATPVPCSAAALRSAAAQGDVLLLAPGCTYRLDAALEVPAGRRLVLQGTQTVLDGRGRTGLLVVREGGTLVVRGLELRDGAGTDDDGDGAREGGAVLALGTLELSDSLVTGSTAGSGGALLVAGTAVVRGSTLTGNRATVAGGGVAVLPGGSLDLARSTLARNVAPRGAGVAADGAVRAVSATVADHAGAGLQLSLTGSLLLAGSAVVANAPDCLRTAGPVLPGTAVPGVPPLGAVVDGVLAAVRDRVPAAGAAPGTLRDDGGNADADRTCLLGARSLSGVRPDLLPLADNGGPTPTLLPRPGSALVDAVPSGSCPAGPDQRGVPRPVGGACDVGAVESRGAAEGAAAGPALPGPPRDPPGPVEPGTGGSGPGSTGPGGTDVDPVGGPDPAPAPGPPGSGPLDPGTDDPRPRGPGPDAPGTDGSGPDASGTGGSGAGGSGTGGSGTGGPDANEAAPGSADGLGGADPIAGGPPPGLAQGPAALAQADGGGAATLGTGRGRLADGLPLPREVSLRVLDLAASGAVALGLVLLLAGPVVVVNKTAEANRDRLRAALSRVLPLPTLPPPRTRPPVVVVATTALLAGVVYTGLDPTAGLDAATLRTVLGLALGVAVVGGVARLTALAVLNRREPVGGLQVFRGFVLVALVCVVLCRLVGLEPGLVLGALSGFTAARTLRVREEGTALAAGYGALAAVTTTAFLLTAPVAERAAGGPGWQVLDTALATVVVAGVQALAFGLVPLRFLDGDALRRGAPAAWALLWGAGVVALVHLVLEPGQAGAAWRGQEPFLLALLCLYLASCTAFWAWFELHPTPPPPADRDLEPEPVAVPG